MASTDDPFQQVHDELWNILEAYADFTDLVKQKNRIKMQGNLRNPYKEEALDQDFPEVRIVPEVGTLNYHASSSDTILSKRWHIQVATGDQRAQSVLFPLEWAIVRALSAWPNYLPALTWNEAIFVCKLDGPSSRASLDHELNRGIKGWTTIMVVEVQMQFPTSTLIPS
jgi:hypothetical protein